MPEPLRPLLLRAYMNKRPLRTTVRALPLTVPVVGEAESLKRRIYRPQQSYGELTRGMTYAMYLLPRQENFDVFAETAEAFFGEVTKIEPKLLAMYGEVLTRIDKTLGTADAPAARRAEGCSAVLRRALL